MWGQTDIFAKAGRDNVLPKRSKRPRSTPRRSIKGLFAQPPAQLYSRTTIYQCGNEMEIENFKTLLDYEDGLIRVDLGHGTLTVMGDRLEIAALEKGRLRLRGIFFKTEFSYD